MSICAFYKATYSFLTYNNTFKCMKLLPLNVMQKTHHMSPNGLWLLQRCPSLSNWILPTNHRRWWKLNILKGSEAKVVGQDNIAKYPLKTPLCLRMEKCHRGRLSPLLHFQTPLLIVLPQNMDQYFPQRKTILAKFTNRVFNNYERRKSLLISMEAMISHKKYF